MNKFSTNSLFIFFADYMKPLLRRADTLGVLPSTKTLKTDAEPQSFERWRSMAHLFGDERSMVHLFG